MLDHEARWWWPFPLAYGLGGSGAVVFGQPVYGRASKNRFIRWAHGRFYAIDRLIWKGRYRLQKKHRYHLVDTGLPPGYYDEDDRMLWACMAILVEHVDRGCGGPAELEKWTQELVAEPDRFHPEMTDRQATSQASVLDIYRWWVIERPLNVATEEMMLEEVYGGRNPFDRSKDEPRERIWAHGDYSAYEDKLRQDDQDMLHRLIDLRPGLWT